VSRPTAQQIQHLSNKPTLYFSIYATFAANFWTRDTQEIVELSSSEFSGLTVIIINTLGFEELVVNTWYM
jgi:hypothetical protein